MCCLPGARIHYVDLGLKRILMAIVGTGGEGRFLLEYARLGKMFKEVEVQLIFSVILPVSRGRRRGSNKIKKINRWLKDWHYEEGWGMFIHWETYTDRILLNGWNPPEYLRY